MAKSSLETLILGENGLGEEGMKEFAKGLAENRTLTYLDMTSNHLGNEGVKMLCEAVS